VTTYLHRPLPSCNDFAKPHPRLKQKYEVGIGLSFFPGLMCNGFMHLISTYSNWCKDKVLCQVI